MKIEDNDYLREFVKSNKDAFDIEVPSKNVWKGHCQSIGTFRIKCKVELDVEGGSHFILLYVWLFIFR